MIVDAAREERVQVVCPACDAQAVVMWDWGLDAEGRARPSGVLVVRTCQCDVSEDEYAEGALEEYDARRCRRCPPTRWRPTYAAR